MPDIGLESPILRRRFPAELAYVPVSEEAGTIFLINMKMSS